MSAQAQFSLATQLPHRQEGSSSKKDALKEISLDLTSETSSSTGDAQQLKTFYIRTYGCQMNELDSEVMAGILQKRGMTPVPVEDEADLLLFNTCSIRDLAERKAMGKIGQISRSDRSKVIGVTGCMANNKQQSLLRKLPSIDFVLGTNNIHELSSVLDEVTLTGKPVVRTDPSFFEELSYTDAVRKSAVSAYVSIIRGCDKYCTYCIVPYTRGPEVSRSSASILEEVKQLAAQGIKEITLLGQNVNSYGKDLGSSFLFHDLLSAIDAIDGIERIRFMTSHPVDITLDLMHAIAELNSVCEMVHFPIQAGSDRILKKMHRIYTKEQYLEKVQKLKAIVPNVALGTDIITGFPTETDAEFEETYQVMQEIDYHVAFIFAYSERKGAPAARWRDDISEEVKQERLQRLLQLHGRAQERHRRALIGSTQEVLVECINAKDTQFLQGRTRCWKNIIFTPEPGRDHASYIGQIVKVKVDTFRHQSLIGHVV